MRVYGDKMGMFKKKIEEIFQRKMDIEKDHLRVKFNLNTRRYDVYYGVKLLSYDDLTSRSRKIIDKKNKLLQTETDLLMQELERAKTSERFGKLKSLGYSCDSFEYLGPVNGTMSKQVEELLNNLLSEENVLLGIHRIGSDDSPNKIEDILVNGLEISGHLGSGVQSAKQLKNNVSYYPNNKTIIKELMYANKYKNSKGSILVRIPDVDLTQNIFIIDDQGRTRLNPKYIVGYIPVSENHHLETIITSKQYNQTYDYSFNGGSIDSEVYSETLEHKMRR